MLLDSGVTELKNVGDQAILSLTLAKYPSATVLNADFPIHRKFRKNPHHWLRYLRQIVKAKHIHIVSGGLFKPPGGMYVIRKYLTVALAKAFRTKVTVGTQTFCLRGISRILFKILFRDLTVPARDLYSLRELESLKIRSVFEDDLALRRERKSSNVDKSLILIDSRMFSEYNVRIVPTMHTDKGWREIEEAVGNAKLVLTCSFHCAVFASNNNVPCVVVLNSEYYRRKCSVLDNVVKVVT